MISITPDPTNLNRVYPTLHIAKFNQNLTKITSIIIFTEMSNDNKTP